MRAQDGNVLARWWLLVWLTCGCLASVSGAELPDADTEFFRGKTVTYLVGTEAGGTYDAYARLIASHMENHLPETQFLVRNVPGAGSIVAANMLYASAADGLTVATLNTGLIYAQIFRSEGIRFDLTEMGWIGKAAADPLVLLISKSAPATTLAGLRDLTSDPVLLGAAGIGSLSQANTALTSSLLDLNTRVISGFTGPGVRFAIIRGDLHGMFGSYSGLRSLADQGYGSFVLRVGGDDMAEVASLPEVGALVASSDAAAVVATLRSVSELGRFTVAPPGVPAERLLALRQAYRMAIEDPRLIADAARLGLPLVPMYGDELADRVRELFDIPEETLGLIWATVGCRLEERQCIPQAR